MHARHLLLLAASVGLLGKRGWVATWNDEGVVDPLTAALRTNFLRVQIRALTMEPDAVAPSAVCVVFGGDGVE